MKGLKKFVAAIVIGCLLGLAATPVGAAVDSKITISIVSTQTGSTQLGATSYPLVTKYEFTWPSGTGANQADRLFSDTRTLAASTAEDLDLAGVLTDAFGAVITFARVNLILICARSTNVNNVVVGNGGVNSFASWAGAAAHTVTVRPGGCVPLIAPDATGYVVTAGTGDLLHVLNGGAGTSVIYDVIIIGRSA